MLNLAILIHFWARTQFCVFARFCSGAMFQNQYVCVEYTPVYLLVQSYKNILNPDGCKQDQFLEYAQILEIPFWAEI